MNIIEKIKILEKVKSINKLKEKFKILNQYVTELHDIFYYAYSPDINYYVKVDIETSNISQSKYTFDDFVIILKQLSERKLSGNNAKNKLSELLINVIAEESILYQKIINRDLQLGIGLVTIKSLYPNLFNDIYVQSPKDYDIEKSIPENKIFEPKIDGIRCLTFISDDIKCYTRNGKRLPFVEPIISKMSISNRNIILDGELFFSSWNDTMSIVSSGNNINKLKYYVFDIMTINEYNSKKTNNILIDRKKILNKYLSNIRTNFLINTEFYQSNNNDDIEKYFDKFINRGFEGLMIKNADSEYKFKRTDDWLRLKQRDMETYECVGIVKGSGKYKDTLGAMIVKIGNDNVKIGSGFTDSDREKYWKTPPIGSMIEVWNYKSTQLDAKARTLVFIRVRDDIS